MSAGGRAHKNKQDERKLVIAPPPARFVVAVRGRVGVVGGGSACVSDALKTPEGLNNEWESGKLKLRERVFLARSLFTFVYLSSSTRRSNELRDPRPKPLHYV